MVDTLYRHIQSIFIVALIHIIAFILSITFSKYIVNIGFYNDSSSAPPSIDSAVYIDSITMEEYNGDISYKEKPQKREQAKTQSASAPPSESSKVLTDIEPIYRENIQYPNQAIKRSIEGVVKLYVGINSSGNVVNVKVKETSGYSILDRASMRAVQKWRFDKNIAKNDEVKIIELNVKYDLSNA